MTGRNLTIGEFRERMRLSDSAAREWLRKGLVSSFRAGRRRLIPEEEVDAFIERAKKENLLKPRRARHQRGVPRRTTAAG